MYFISLIWMTIAIFVINKQFYMKFIITFSTLLLLSLNVNAQTKFNMELLSHIDWQEQGSGCWGHTDANGIEYAVIGTRKAIRVLSLEDPTNPISRLEIPGATTTWREARSYGNFIYVTTEGPDGVTIIDATNAPNSFTWKRWKPAIALANNDTLRTVHSINIDSEGFLYLNGHNLSNRGVLIFDLKQDGYNPTLVANMGTVYTHDCFATKTTLYTADLSNGVGVYEISDKANPVLINRFNTSSVFAHNIWTSPDEKYLYTTDERSGAYVDVYDVSDLKNIKFISKYRNEDTKLGSVIPHNTYAVENYAVTSWYTDGVLIKDMSRPDNIVKVGEFDTYQNEATLPENGTWFEGCWGVYPFLKSGTIVASDINTGLWIFRPKYARASYLEGKTLVEDETGQLSPITGAKVSIKASRSAFGISNQNGVYKTGIAEPGMYKIFFTHPEFGLDSVELELKTGEVVNHDFIFKGKNIVIKVIDNNKAIIANAAATLTSKTSQNTLSAVSNGNGYILSTLNPGSQYTLQVAAWGYKGKEVDVTSFDTLTVELEKGYQDDFFADLGWVNTKKVSAGNWERVIPKGTTLNQDIANPDKDAEGDIGGFAYVTGNGGATVGENDVDNGATILVSPIMDFTGKDTASISYQSWFFNGGGTGSPNDEMIVELSNGLNTITLDQTSFSLSEWLPKTFNIVASNFTFTDKMQLSVSVNDKSPGHIVEGGIDAFNVKLSSKLVGTKDVKPLTIKMAPNPVVDFLNVSADVKIINISIYDISSKKVISSDSERINVNSLPAGVYIGKAQSADGRTTTFKINKI